MEATSAFDFVPFPPEASPREPLRGTIASTTIAITAYQTLDLRGAPLHIVNWDLTNLNSAHPPTTYQELLLKGETT